MKSNKTFLILTIALLSGCDYENHREFKGSIPNPKFAPFQTIKNDTTTSDNRSNEQVPSTTAYIFFNLPKSRNEKNDELKARISPTPKPGTFTKSELELITANTNYKIQKDKLEKIKQEAAAREAKLEVHNNLVFQRDHETNQ